MFKLAFVLVALAAFASASIVPAPVVAYDNGSLGGVLAEFGALVDTEEIALVLLSYLFDPEFQVAMQWLFSPEFQALYLEVSVMPETLALIDFLIEGGVDVYGIANAVREFLGIPPITRANTRIATRAGLSGLIQELIGIMPIEELRALADYHVENTPEFAELYARLQSDEFSVLANRVYAHPTVQSALITLEGMSIDMDRVREIIETVFGWNLGGQ